MESQTVYFTGMMIFILISQMYHRISVLRPVLVHVPEYLSPSTSTNMSALELTSTSKVRVPEIQYSSISSTSPKYEHPSPITYHWFVVEKLHTNKFGDAILCIVCFTLLDLNKLAVVLQMTFGTHFPDEKCLELMESQKR